jgi:hypothetical protein
MYFATVPFTKGTTRLQVLLTDMPKTVWKRLILIYGSISKYQVVSKKPNQIREEKAEFGKWES